MIYAMVTERLYGATGIGLHIVVQSNGSLNTFFAKQSAGCRIQIDQLLHEISNIRCLTRKTK